MKKRIIYSDNTVLNNITDELNNYHTGETGITFVAAEDALYVGSNLPFNHLYCKMGATVNENASVMTVELWDGTEWQAVAELNDGTDLSGATFGQSGYVEFTPDKNENWTREDTVDADGTESVTGLGDIKIYDKYWVKITASADLTANLTIAWIGQIFSDDDDLDSEYPELLDTSLMSAIKSGKTDYQEQAVRSANIIIKDLKRKKIILDKNQILVREDLMLSSVSKIAEITYTMLGDDYVDNKAAAKKEYIERLNSAFPIVDKNNNARVEPVETIPDHGNLFR